MSSYYRCTKHPETGNWEFAAWLDDYFAKHHYGVLFGDGRIFNPREVKIQTKGYEEVIGKNENTRRT